MVSEGDPMIAQIYFDDMITVPRGRATGPDARATLQEQSFNAADGWQIIELSEGVFSLYVDGMTGPVTVGGYGYTYVRQADHIEAEAEEPSVFVVPDESQDVEPAATPKRRGRPKKGTP